MKTHVVLICLMAILTNSLWSQNDWTSIQKSGGTNNEISTDICELADGGKVVVGTYWGDAVFGSYTLPFSNSGSSPTATNSNAFITKYSLANSVLWATRITSSYGVIISAVTSDANGNIYVCGSYNDEPSFFSVGNPNPNQLLHNSKGGNEGFIAKYSNAGALIWRLRAVPDEIGVVTDIAINDDGTMLAVSGRLTGVGTSIAIGSGSVTDGSYVMWIDPASGNPVRAYNYTNNSAYLYTDVFKTGLTFDHADNLIVAGRMTGTSYIVSGATGTLSVTSTGGNATLYAKYNSTGGLLWAKASRATVSNVTTTPSSVIVDEDNNIYLAGGVLKSTANFDLQFPASSTTYHTVYVPTTAAKNGYIVKLDKNSGFALWKGYARNTDTGGKVISLAKGKCNFIYACVNSETSPTYTDPLGLVLHGGVSSTKGAFVFCLNTSGNIQVIAPWIVNNTYDKAQIATNGKPTIQFATTAMTASVTIPTSSSTISITPSGKDVIFGTITNTGSPISVSLNSAGPFCENQTYTITANLSGSGAPFTYTWSIYDNATGTYIDMGTTTSPSYNVPPLAYDMYDFDFLGNRVFGIRVIVTNCAGTTAMASNLYAVKKNIQYTQVTESTTCYKPMMLAADAVFSVNAQNAEAYSWQYSSDGGISWSACIAPAYTGANTATLTVETPSSSQNGYLFRCIISGCPSNVTTNAAKLNVIPCPLRRSSPVDSGGQEVSEEREFNLYPNPTSTTLNIHFEERSSSFSDGTHTAYILDVTGRQVGEISLESNQGEFSVVELANGSYTCIITNGSTVIDQKRFIVAR